MIEVTLIALSITLLYMFCKSRRNLPPGPPRIPLLGSLPFISLNKGLLSWVLDRSVISHKVATVGLGSQNIYVINNYELAKELFNREEFSGRGVSEFFLSHKGFDGKPFGIIMTEGSHWSRERRFGLKTLKGLGFGKQSLEENINIEVEELITSFLSGKEDFHLSNNFNAPIINILWQIVAGQRFTPDDPEGMEMLASVNRQFEIIFNMEVFPLKIMKMFPKATNYAEMVNILDTQKRFIMKQIEEHECTIDPEHPRDFVDVYLDEMRSCENFTKNDLVLSMMDFLHAGAETSSTTLKWIVLYLTVYQDVQDKCREEIDSLLGNSLCSVTDMVHLPYVQATISEVQRLSLVAPMTLLHKTNANTRVEGFTFDSGSWFVVNLSSIMMDPENFPEPEVFNPDRFLGPSGNYEKNERLVPFGIGKRACMGELLARNEVFLFTVNLLQRMKFLPPANNLTPDPANYSANFTNIPHNFYVRFVKA
eukprot:GFUD01011940.1.p1 GENE.GFUD01011940.1~~GFUD01011940.1.p1  ORF type:complete len:480 (+),score=113.71 GFUD01011940.1:179-1618(+)